MPGLSSRCCARIYHALIGLQIENMRRHLRPRVLHRHQAISKTRQALDANRHHELHSFRRNASYIDTLLCQH